MLKSTAGYKNPTILIINLCSSNQMNSLLFSYNIDTISNEIYRLHMSCNISVMSHVNTSNFITSLVLVHTSRKSAREINNNRIVNHELPRENFIFRNQNFTMWRVIRSE